MFDMQPVRPPASDRPARKKWGGRESTNARAACRRMFPFACLKCGGIIDDSTPEKDWHAGHLEDRMDHTGNQQTVPEHAWCNTSAGGKRGAQITNGSKVTVTENVRERTLKWW